jgi:hypothetical protein
VQTSIGTLATPRVPAPVSDTLPVAAEADVRSVTVTPVIDCEFATIGRMFVMKLFPHAVPKVVHVAGPGVPPENVKKLRSEYFCPMLFCM